MKSSPLPLPRPEDIGKVTRHSTPSRRFVCTGLGCTRMGTHWVTVPFSNQYGAIHALRCDDPNHHRTDLVEHAS